MSESSDIQTTASSVVALPDSYVQQMQALLGVKEADEFLASFNAPRAYGLRLNPLKLSDDANQPAIQALKQQFSLRPIPWCETGYYYNETTRPGKHPYHQAGIYYIQEPSAMSAAQALDPQPGETILDLAAAPGGKTTQIAGRMQGEGLLISNEIHPARARILSENVERYGIRNAVVTCAPPDVLSARFPLFFDRIMLDAPCSGEGMFRKDPDAIGEWSPDHVQMCADRQADILEHAAIMLKPGGRLVYSTCTFNRSENELAMEAFLAKHPEFKLERTERLWPHHCEGEGHFVAVLTKDASMGYTIFVPMNQAATSQRDQRNATQRGKGKPKSSGSNSSLASDMALFEAFAVEALPGFKLGPGEPVRFGDALYWLPHDREGRFSAASIEGLKVVRPGLQLGELKTKRIEPAHALALAIRSEEAAQLASFEAEAPETAAYLRGEALSDASGNLSGWTIAAVDGFPLGWAKASGGQLKNHLPKGLRRLT
ncbi:23S rRNA methyltransferase [Paenibacillus sp. CCS19]|uniref:RsmB/NOP family class I SAM-dependent RNA methyltransferase n=1 Tax=Paenibacillus sp. CCS19 TaxID=3158387 RepID=UPI00256728A3|nr:RsmB/NOP family class I SAM-dependent RNA methyltransferase [Paenibacillus cellulosilyticus]GMK39591.1 23S rRNA methyltransferase [Paenibacillus cellulosilyticus]